MSEYTLNPNLQIRLKFIGKERVPLVVVDDVLYDPHRLVDFAISQGGFIPADGPDGGFPGVKANVPIEYAEGMIMAFDPIMRKAFALGDAALAQGGCSFSMVTRLPTSLHPLQQIPHIDTAYPLQFALLHYLCGDNYSGTAFYRHTASGFETIDPERLTYYDTLCSAEQLAYPSTGSYPNEAMPHYERTGAVAAKFNRLAIYPSQLLHSGIINPGQALPDDPRTGRLTGNFFVTYRDRG